MPKETWTQEEIDLLVKNYPTTRNADLVELVGHSLSGLKFKAKGLKLKKDPAFKGEVRAEIGRAYQATLGPARRSQPQPKLKEFCQKESISLSTLAEIVGIGKGATSSIGSLFNGRSSESYGHHLLQMVKEKLPEWLRDVRGWDEERINTAMEEIFKEDFKALMAKKIALDGADLQFFNLRQDPFLHPPRSTSEVFRSDEFEEILERVLDAIQYQGYIAVLGDIGSGKTTLKLMVEEALMERRNFNLIQPRFADMSKITATRVIQRLLKNFIDKAPANVEEAQHKCIGVLEEQYKNGQRTALMFDECHRLSDLTISTTKNFLEQYARGFTRFLGVVFLGQYSFESRLKDPAFSEIYQRVNIVQMPDFRGTLAEKYLAHRLKLIGAKVADLMDAEAVEYICANAPTPLMLGNIVNTALQKSREFSNEKVFGGFIKTQMHFPKDKAGPEFKLVGAGR